MEEGRGPGLRLGVRALGLLVLVALLGGACSSKFKGEVVVYTPFPEICAKELAKAFEKKTNIKVDMVMEGTSKVLGRLRAEKDNPKADVWYGAAGMIAFISATKQGLLEPYQPKGYEDLPVSRGNLILRDEAFHWTGIAIIGMGYAYNPKRVTDPPKTWDELALERWKGKIEMWDPSSSGTAVLFLMSAIQRYGEEKGWAYLHKVFENLKRYTVEGKPAFNVVRGESDIGIHFEHQVLEFLEEQSGGDPVDNSDRNIRWYLPPESPVIVDPVALIKGAPHPEEARLFIDFVLSPEGQKIINRFFFTIDPSFGPPANLEGVTLKDMEANAQHLDPVWMADEMDAIRKKWQNEVETTREDE